MIKSVITLLMLLVVFIGTVSADSFTCPIKRPAKHNEVQYALCRANSSPYEDEFKNWPEYNIDIEEIDRFDNDEICVCYGYKGDAVGFTAINITVRRYFRKARFDLIHKTTLYRNNGFLSKDGSSAPAPINEIENETYDSFHFRKKIDRDLKNKFHAYWKNDSSGYTLEPDERRIMFTFLPPGTRGKYYILRRSYLIRFEANQNGSWVPFRVGTGARGKYGKYLDKFEMEIADLSGKGLNAEVLYEMKRKLEN